MKRLFAGIAGLLLISVAALSAESLDKVWIIRSGTGASVSPERIEDPVVAPGQVIEVYVEEQGLSARWGEGFAYYTYTYYSEMGKKIWTSREYTEKKRTSDETWTFSVVRRIDVPLDIPEGSYRIGFELTDYHTKIVYEGSVVFTVSSSPGGESGSGSSAESDEEEIGTAAGTGIDAGAEEKIASVSEPDASALSGGSDGSDGSDGSSGDGSSGGSDGSGDYTSMIGDVELSLVAVEKSDNLLTITLRGVNRGEADEELRLYSYMTRIVSGRGEEFSFSEHGGSDSKFVRGLDFPPDVPMQESFSFTQPVPGKVAHISYLEIPFYYREEKVTWRDIPVPWLAGE